MGTTNRGLTPDDPPPSAGLSRRDFFSLVGRDDGAGRHGRV